MPTYAKLSEKNTKGEFEIKMTIQIPSDHPVLY